MAKRHVLLTPEAAPLRSRCRRAGVGLGLISIVLTAGCSSILPVESAPKGSPPLPPDPTFTAVARAICILEHELGPADAQPVLQDRREPDVALVVLATDEWDGACILRRSGDQFTFEAGAGGDNFVRGASVALTMWSPFEDGGIVVGRVAPPVQRVDVTRADGVVLEASTNGQVFAAWWAQGGEVDVVVGRDADGRETGRDSF